MKHSNLFSAFVIAIFLILYGCASTTPLIKASKEGNYQAVQKLIDAGANINEPDSKEGYNALFYAVEYGQLEVVNILISKGANLESKDSLGMTPLAFAANYGYNSPNADNIIKMLIKSGANINAKSPGGETVLDFSLSSAKGDLVDYLIKSKDINLWAPDTGKARIFFVCKDLYDYIKVTVGRQSKKLNQNTKSGVTFIDVDPGTHVMDANYDQYVSKNRASVDVMAGQTYYFRVTQNMRNRALGYVMFSSALVDNITSTNSFPITTLKESEAKQEIKGILKAKELE